MTFAQRLVLNPSNGRTVEGFEREVHLAMRDSLAGTNNPSQYLIEFEQFSAGEHGLRRHTTTFLRVHQGEFISPIFVESISARSMLVTTVEATRNEPIIFTRKVLTKRFRDSTQELSNESDTYLRLFDVGLLDFSRKERMTSESLRRAISDNAIWSPRPFAFLHERLRESYSEQRITTNHKGIPA